jgi:hypothetical protein
MGAWNTNLIGNDTVQDFFIKAKKILKIENFAEMVNENSLDKNVKSLIEEKREELLNDAKNEYSWESSMAILAYIGILKMLHIEMTKKEIEEFNKALQSEYEDSSGWTETELRKSYLKALEVAVRENADYDFSMKI